MLSILSMAACGHFAGGLGVVFRIRFEDHFPDLGLNVGRVIVLAVGPDEVDRIVCQAAAFVTGCPAVMLRSLTRPSFTGFFSLVWHVSSFVAFRRKSIFRQTAARLLFKA